MNPAIAQLKGDVERDFMLRAEEVRICSKLVIDHFRDTVYETDWLKNAESKGCELVTMTTFNGEPETSVCLMKEGRVIAQFFAAEFFELTR